MFDNLSSIVCSQIISCFLQSCWWGVLLSVVGFAIVMGIFIKCCAVHTPSSNPRKAPALRITDTLRHPADTLRRKVCDIVLYVSSIT